MTIEDYNESITSNTRKSKMNNTQSAQMNIVDLKSLTVMMIDKASQDRSIELLNTLLAQFNALEAENRKLRENR
jgi:hypothetical protein